MSSLAAIALSGLNAAQAGLRTSAHNIANLGTAGFRRQELMPASDGAAGGVTASLRQAAQPGNALATDMVGQLQARNAFLANLAVFRADDRMVGSLLDALA